MISLSVFITITLLNTASLLLFYAIHKNTNHVVKSCERVIGGSTFHIVATKTVAYIKFFYAITVVALIVASYFIFNHPW